MWSLARTQALFGNRMTITRSNPAMMFPIPRQIAVKGNRSLEGGSNAKTTHAEAHAAIATIKESTFAVLRLGFILLTDGATSLSFGVVFLYHFLMQSFLFNFLRIFERGATSHPSKLVISILSRINLLVSDAERVFAFPNS